MVNKSYVDQQVNFSIPRIGWSNPDALVVIHGLEYPVTWSELVKYIRERELVANNETVRSLWERYQVAVKLVGSKDHG